MIEDRSRLENDCNDAKEETMTQGSLGAAAVLALVLAGPAGAAELKPVATIAVPGVPLDGFDIGVVDQKTQRYYLADRSNKAVDIFDAKEDKFLGRVPGFIGVTKSNDTSGPDGVILVGNQIWAGDGDSTIKIIDIDSRKIVKTISTGGKNRVDEMAYDPKDGVFVGVNNADEPPFVTLISTKKGNKILGKIDFEDATDGLEQPAYNPADGMIYVSVPELKKEATKGGVAVIDPRKAVVVKILPVDNCHPNGLVFGPANVAALGCTAEGKENMPPIITLLDVKTGAVVKNVPGIGAADMVAYDRKLGQFYTASRNMPGGPVLGVIETKTNGLVQKIALTGGNPHSVAVNSANGHVYVPVGASKGGCGCIQVFAPR
jgi:DNA-binding beta-propeller fold protein YncE